MEFFARAKTVRLKSQHNKYLVAADDEESVKQSRNGSSKNARWSVEPVDNKPNVIRLKSCLSWKYLRATDDPFLLGMTGRRVCQSSPRLRLDLTVEWEPIKEGSSHVKLRTRKGNFLRANGGIPPWNNSVTTDVPSRSSTQEWILWSVDVLEVDYQSTEGTDIKNSDSVTEKNDNGGGVKVGGDYGSLSRNSSSGSTISKADYFKDCFEVESDEKLSSVNQVKQNNPNSNFVNKNEEDDNENASLSRKSSLVSKSDIFKDWSENEVVTPPAPKSVRRRPSATQLPTQSPKASPQKSEKPAQVSPFGRHVREEPKHSDSFHKLKSVLDGLEDLLDDDYEHDAQSDETPEPVVESPVHKPHALEVKMAKHTLRELEDLDYEAFLSSGKENKLEDAVKVLIADVKMSGRGQIVPNELLNLREQLKSMKLDHNLALQDIEEGTAFSIRRLEVKGELKKDASKAHELEALEVDLSNVLTNERAKREELLRQLEEVENTIKVTEKAKADNDAEIDEIVSRIGEKSESLREMERNEKSWQARKVEAERKLERVEADWVKMQILFEEI